MILLRAQPPLQHDLPLDGRPLSDMGTAQCGAPFAMSFTLSGEPARVDIHIPLKAIERAVQAFSPQQPM